MLTNQIGQILTVAGLFCFTAPDRPNRPDRPLRRLQTAFFVVAAQDLDKLREAGLSEGIVEFGIDG
jgi:hypothetical protein